jgi:hypothetical protein
MDPLTLIPDALAYAFIPSVGALIWYVGRFTPKHLRRESQR